MPLGFKQTFEHSNALFEAALKEFIARGYDQASLNAILKTTKMSKGQFYYHFKNKEALYFTLIEVLINSKREFFASVMEQSDLSKDIFTVFKLQIHYGLMFTEKYPLIDQFVKRFLKEVDHPINQKVLSRYHFQQDSGFNALIEQAYQNGDLRSDIPLPILQAVISHLFTHAGELLNLNREASIEENLSHLISFMKHGATQEK